MKLREGVVEIEARQRELGGAPQAAQRRRMSCSSSSSRSRQASIVIANGESDADGAGGLDAASRVHEIALPAIVACGELDVAIKVRRSAQLADAVPNATYRSLPGRAHLPYLEAAEEIAALTMAEVV